jgi:hypothetical protein
MPLIHSLVVRAGGVEVGERALAVAALQRVGEQRGADPAALARRLDPEEEQERVGAYDRELTDLVGELSTRSEEFRRHWAKHDVRFHISGVKRYHHAQVGDLQLNYERLDVVFDTGTRSAEALSLLSSLAATSAAEQAPAQR